MEDNTPTPLNAPPPAARTAQALRELHEHARNALTAQRERMAQLEAQLTRQLDNIADTIAEQIAGQDAPPAAAQQSLEEVERLRVELESARQAWNAEREAQQAELDARQQTLDDRAAALNHQDRDLHEQKDQLDSQTAQLDQAREELAKREQTLQESAASLAAEREALRAERDEVAGQRDALKAAEKQQETEAGTKLAAMERQLQEERDAWQHERTTVEQQRGLLAEERDDLAAALEAARSELTEARANATSAADFDALRAERDTLAARVAELEQQPGPVENAEVAQERSDLQRRLELAIDDVRELKKANAELEARLAASPSGAAPAASAGGGSWESLKKQMLADLEGEGDVDDDRQQERVAIEDTIRLTDEALAKKDRELAELKSRLTKQTEREPDRDRAVRELVDADEVIAEHRARIAKLEAEMTDKLRTAELELSVERAKIARDTVQLDELRADLEAQRANAELIRGTGGTQHPKRRWLSKLGLGSDEESRLLRRARLPPSLVPVPIQARQEPRPPDRPARYAAIPPIRPRCGRSPDTGRPAR